MLEIAEDDVFLSVKLSPGYKDASTSAELIASYHFPEKKITIELADLLTPSLLLL
jgi:hypothetical protein